MTTDRLTDERLTELAADAATGRYPSIQEQRAILAELRASRAAATTGETLEEKHDRGLDAAEDVIKALVAGAPKCSVCGERPATCVGAYEDRVNLGFGCDECCGHGNEDGWCVPLAGSTAREDGAAAPCDECGRVASDEERLRHAFRPGLCNNPGGWAPPLDREALTTCGACGSRAPAPGAAPATAAARDGEGA